MSDNNAIKARLDAMLGGETQNLSEINPSPSGNEAASPSSFRSVTEDVGNQNPTLSNVTQEVGAQNPTLSNETQDVSGHNPISGELFTKEAISDTISLLVPGKVIAGHYRIIRRLGAGGMGTVFKAEDITLNNKIFAIKVLNPELSCDDKAIESLKKEALSAMELHHTNIMTVNAFEGLSNIKFLVMEFLDGPDLENTIEDKGTLTIEETMDVARQVCPALDFAHSRNIIHRDIKPANMVYKMEAGTRVVKIADLGIAFSESDIGEDGKVQAIGTLFYMAPELFDGTPPTPQSDQYALACTFYEFLSGKPPIIGQSVKEVIKKVREIEVTPIEGISLDLNKALLRALSKDRSQRYATCSILLEEMVKATELKGVASAATARQGAELKHFLNSHAFDDPEDEQPDAEVAENSNPLQGLQSYDSPEQQPYAQPQQPQQPYAQPQQPQQPYAQPQQPQQPYAQPQQPQQPYAQPQQPQQPYAQPQQPQQPYAQPQQPQQPYAQPQQPQVAPKAEFTVRSHALLRPKGHTEAGFDTAKDDKSCLATDQVKPDYAAQRMDRLDSNIANAKKTIMMGLAVSGIIIVLLLLLFLI